MTDHITDHALLRYLERVKGIDVQAAAQEIDAVLPAGLVRDAPSGFRLKRNGVEFVVVNQCVVTIVAQGEAIQPSQMRKFKRMAKKARSKVTHRRA